MECRFCPSPGTHYLLVWTGSAQRPAFMSPACAECTKVLRERLPITVRCDLLDESEADLARVMVEPEEGTSGMLKLAQNAMRTARLASILGSDPGSSK